MSRWLPARGRASGRPDRPRAAALRDVLAVEEYGGVRLLRTAADETPGRAEIDDLVRALGAADAGTVTVVTGPPASSADALWARLGGLLDDLREDEITTVRLAMSGAGHDRPGRPAVARRIADAWGLDVIAPDGGVVMVPGGGLFAAPRADGGAPPAAGSRGPGWLRFGPGTEPVALGPRQPAPDWQTTPGTRTVRTTAGGCLVEDIPAGLLVRPRDARPPRPGDLCFAVPVDPRGPTVVVGVPDGEDVLASDVQEAVASLPAPSRTRLRVSPGGRRDVLGVGQALADALGCDVVVHTGLPLLTEGPAGGATVRATLADEEGLPLWHPYVDSVACAPRPAADAPAPAPRLLRWSPPLPGRAHLASGEVRLSDRWRVTVTRSGLWISGRSGPPPPVAARPVSAQGPAVEVGRPGEPLDATLWPELARLLGASGPDWCARARLHVQGVCVDGGRELRRLAGLHQVRSLRFGAPVAATAPAPPGTGRPGPTASAAPAAPATAGSPHPAGAAVRAAGTTGAAVRAAARAAPARVPQPSGTGPGATAPATRPVLVGERAESAARPAVRTGPAAPATGTAAVSTPAPSPSAAAAAGSAGGGTPPPGPASVPERPQARPEPRAEAHASSGPEHRPDAPSGPTAGDPAPASPPVRTAVGVSPGTAPPAPAVPAVPEAPEPAPPIRPRLVGATPSSGVRPPEAPETAREASGPPGGTTVDGVPAAGPRRGASTRSDAGAGTDPAANPDPAAAPDPAATGAGRATGSALVAPPPVRPEPPVRSEAPTGDSGRRPVVPTATAATTPFLPGHHSTEAERAAFRVLADGVWERHGASVNRTLSRMPALRGSEQESARADLIALQLYLRTDEGGLSHEALGRALRSGDGTLLPYAACVASGLRRLPSYRGAVVREAPPGAASAGVGDVLLAPEPVSALPVAGETAPHPPGAAYAVWSVSGRRVRHLLDAPGQDGAAGEVVFPPGSAFRVLDVRAPHGDGTGPLVLLAELPPPRPGVPLLQGPLGAGDLATLARLDAALSARPPTRPDGPAHRPWPHRCSGPIGSPTH
ncbi:hypothetical protein [uncultured Streptomyces sp.]|uniref:hypothetical protein n=1 Tax=uncultured Streptomyces sp. TaxID=174707 RepID=UPI00260F5DA4|nr:hypothetical protein [uncultured Streptomyces sp.]